MKIIVVKSVHIQFEEKDFILDKDVQDLLNFLRSEKITYDKFKYFFDTKDDNLKYENVPVKELSFFLRLEKEDKEVNKKIKEYLEVLKKEELPF